MNQTKSSWSFHETSLERSFLWSLAVTSLPVVSGFVVSWVVARFAGADVIGVVSWVMSFATAALILAKSGLDLAASRMASDYGVTSPGTLRQLFSISMRLRAVFTVSVAAIILVFAPQIARFFGDPGLLNPIRIGALVIACASIYEFDENFLIGLNRHSTVYRIRLFHLALRIAASCALVALGLGATAILGGYCGAWILATIVYAVLLRRYLPEPRSGSADVKTRRLLMLSVTLAISSASVTIYSHMDRLMIGYFVGVEEVGQYAVARNTVEVALFPVFAIVMMLRPALASRFAAGQIPESAHIIRGTLRLSLISGVLFAGVFAALGVPLVTFVFSNSFWLAGELMLLFVGVVVFRSIGAVILPALVAADRTRVYAYLTTISAVVNFGLNALLIPRFHARGAIVATIISYGVLLFAGLREVFVTYAVRLTPRAISAGLRTILAGVVSSGIIWWVVGHGEAGWTALLWAAILAVLYLSLLILFRVGSLGEVRTLVTNLRQSKG